MVNVTEAAKAQFDKFFEDKEKSSIRIYLGSSGCCGPALSMALDEAQDDDLTFDVAGFTFVVDKALSEAAGELTVDMNYYGFSVQAQNDITGQSDSCSTGGAGACGSGCCGGCH